MEYTKEQIIKALADVMDGNCNWYEIRDSTGLSKERCQEIQEIALACIFSHMDGGYE